MTDPGDVALLLASHGTSSVTGRAAVGALVAAVRSAAAVEVRGGFVDVQPPDVQRLMTGLAPERPAVIVPLLLSAGYHVRVDLARAARDAARPVVVAGALGPDDGLVRVLARRLEEAGATDADAVVLAVAGSSDAGAVRDCREVARRLAVLLGAEVRIGFLSAAEPRLADAVLAARTAQPGRVAVATYLLAPGYFFDLVLGSGADLVAAPLLDAAGPPAPELVAAVLARHAVAVRGLPARPLTAVGAR